MNRIWRLLLLKLRTMFVRIPQRSLWGVHRMRMQVTLRDLDLLRHVNNGSYLQLMDVGRVDMLTRAGMWAMMKRLKWISVVTNETITFRRSLKLGQRFTLETQIIGWDRHCFIVEQRVVRGDEICVQAYVRQLFLGPKGALPPKRVLEQFGAPDALPAVPQWVIDWAAASQLPRNRVHTPSVWERPGPYTSTHDGSVPADAAGAGAAAERDAYADAPGRAGMRTDS